MRNVVSKRELTSRRSHCGQLSRSHVIGRIILSSATGASGRLEK
jgi:hypothetical protein